MKNNKSTDKTELGSGFKTVPVLDEKTFHELGERQVDNFYTKAEISLSMIRSTGSRGTERIGQ